MRKSGLEAIRYLLEQDEKCSRDQHGHVQCLHGSWLDNLRIEYDEYCRKHNVRPGKKVTLSQ